MYLRLLLIALLRLTETGSTPGTQFVLYAGPGSSATDAAGNTLVNTYGLFRAVISSHDIRGALVTATCPRCEEASRTIVADHYIAFGQSHVVVGGEHAGTSPAHSRTGKQDFAILLTSSFPVSVLVNSNYVLDRQDTFLALPVDTLDNKYILTGHGTDNEFLAVIGIEAGRTSIRLMFEKPSGQGQRSIPPCEKTPGGIQTEAGAGKIIYMDVDQYEVYLLLCTFKTGSFLYADKTIAAFIGNLEMALMLQTDADPPTTGNRLGHTQEQAMPTGACGNLFVVPGMFIPDDSFIRIVACYDDVRVVCRQEETKLQRAGDYIEIEVEYEHFFIDCTDGCHAVAVISSTKGTGMVHLVSVHNFIDVYTFSTVSAGPNADDIFVVMLIILGDVDGLCWNDHCGGWKLVTDSVEESKWQIWIRLDSGGQQTVYHLSKEAIFGLYLYRSSTDVSLTALGVKLPTMSCRQTIMEKGDNIDNDCDGNVDEELENGEDDDFDGLIDEDVGANKKALLHGHWGEWTSWRCGIQCDGWGKLRRYRVCNRPPPRGGGRPCKGPNYEESNGACDRTKVRCQKDCPLGLWGVGCTHTCPINCKQHRCDPFTGSCLSCPVGKIGEQCNMDCPVYKFGENCTQSCREYCHNFDCDPVTGDCDTGIYLYFILVCTGLSIFPAVIIHSFVLLCYNRDLDRLKISDAVKKIDHQITRARCALETKKMTEDTMAIIQRQVEVESAIAAEAEAASWSSPHSSSRDATSFSEELRAEGKKASGQSGLERIKRKSRQFSADSAGVVKSFQSRLMSLRSRLAFDSRRQEGSRPRGKFTSV